MRRLRHDTRQWAWMRIIFGMLLAMLTFYLAARTFHECGKGYAVDGPTLVAPSALTLLIIGQQELPWDVILGSLEYGSQAKFIRYKSLSADALIAENWSGPPVTKPGNLTNPHHSISIRLAIAKSSAEAADAALKEATSQSMPIPEITGSPDVRSFADRAWYSAGRIIFTRSNVVGDIHLSNKDGYDQKLLFELAARLGGKIQAALDGKPQPEAALPLSAEERCVGLSGAWAARERWKDADTLYIRDTNGLVRGMPARALGGQDFQVSLQSLCSVLDLKARVQFFREDGDNGMPRARITLGGHTLKFHHGDAKLVDGTREIPLAQAVTFKDGEVLVPFSLVTSVLGWQAVRENVDGRTVVRFDRKT
jgi:hypothetical protein